MTPWASRSWPTGISAEREAYLALGGLGILVGDGRLPHPGGEQILETYTSVGLYEWLHLSLDYQRLHASF